MNMQSRFVSVASLILVLASVVLFMAGAWGVMSWRLDEGSGVLGMAACLLVGLVFSYRYADPRWLDPISIVKSR
jgi:hypothetical protein